MSLIPVDYTALPGIEVITLRKSTFSALQASSKHQVIWDHPAIEQHSCSYRYILHTVTEQVTIRSMHLIHKHNTFPLDPEFITHVQVPSSKYREYSLLGCLISFAVSSRSHVTDKTYIPSVYLILFSTLQIPPQSKPIVKRSSYIPYLFYFDPITQHACICIDVVQIYETKEHLLCCQSLPSFIDHC